MAKDEQFALIKFTVEEGLCARKCFECGFEVADSGRGAWDRVSAAFEAHLAHHIVLEGPMPISCDTYWGSHGCRLPKGHGGPCVCDCDDPSEYDPITRLDADGVLHVGACPYYGADTNFYGDDATPEHVEALRAFIKAAK